MTTSAYWVRSQSARESNAAQGAVARPNRRLTDTMAPQMLRQHNHQTAGRCDVFRQEVGLMRGWAFRTRGAVRRYRAAGLRRLRPAAARCSCRARSAAPGRRDRRQRRRRERDFLSRVRRLTVEGKRAGEGYWAPDGKRLVFQSEREPGNPVLPDLRASISTTRRHQTHLARHGQDDVRVLPRRQRSDSVCLDASRSQLEATPGRRARLPRLGQRASLLVGLRPRDGDLRRTPRRRRRSRG